MPVRKEWICMTNIELRTRSIFDQLNNSEKKVASYFLANVDSVFNQPIAQLAAASGVSQVAWVRFCKRIGFYGLKDLKKSLFSELNDAQQASGVSHSESYADIKDHTTVQQIKDTVKNSSIQAIENTMQLLDCEAVQKAAQNLISADSIKIFGVGASALVSEDLYNKLLNSSIFPDSINKLIRGSITPVKAEKRANIILNNFTDVE